MIAAKQPEKLRNRTVVGGIDGRIRLQKQQFVPLLQDRKRRFKCRRKSLQRNRVFSEKGKTTKRPAGEDIRNIAQLFQPSELHFDLAGLKAAFKERAGQIRNLESCRIQLFLPP